MRLIFIGLLILTAFNFCKKKDVDRIETERAFKWVELGKKFHFDVYDFQDTLYDYRCVVIAPGAVEDKFEFNECTTEDANAFRTYLNNISFSFYVEKDGLYSTRCASCSGFECWFSGGKFIRIPKEPVLNDSLPIYLCADEIMYYINFINLDTVIETRAGKFNCFVTTNTYSHDKIYWNKEIGIVGYDSFEGDKTPRGIARLCYIE